LKKKTFKSPICEDVLNEFITEINNNDIQLKNYSLPDSKYFRVLFSIENKLVSADRSVIHEIVEKIKKLTKKQYSYKNTGAEFWFFIRREQVAFWALRITNNKKKTLRGELRPELTHLLCRLSEPKEMDIFLDPFCGTGTIPLERSRISKFNIIFACDTSRNLTDKLKDIVAKTKNKKLKRSFMIKNRDFFNNGFENNFIDVIATDPPWGIYQQIEDNFYQKFIDECHRILKKGGRLVVLVSRDNFFPEETKNGFAMDSRYNILVSGKKAEVFVFIKNG
jgi:tRNA G10  N-methylase Trm11